MNPEEDPGLMGLPIAGPAEQIQPSPSFTKSDLFDVIKQINNNRRLTAGINNFRPNDEEAIGVNPMPAQPLAGKLMQQFEPTTPQQIGRYPEQAGRYMQEIEDQEGYMNAQLQKNKNKNNPLYA